MSVGQRMLRALYHEAMCWWDFHELDELGYPPDTRHLSTEDGEFGGSFGGDVRLDFSKGMY